MKALALVPRFQERLEVSRVNAIWRVIGFIFLSVCFIATVVISVTLFPYAASFTEEVSLLPGNHIQVQEILDGEVAVNRTKFLQVAEGNVSFVAPGEKTVVYMTKVAGISYRHDQALVPLRLAYSISSQRIQNGIVVREISRNIFGMIVLHIILPLFLLFLLFLLVGNTQAKRVSGWGSGANYRHVWE